jgi:hypothetical protein
MLLLHFIRLQTKNDAQFIAYPLFKLEKKTMAYIKNVPKKSKIFPKRKKFSQKKEKFSQKGKNFP